MILLKILHRRNGKLVAPNTSSRQGMVLTPTSRLSSPIIARA